QVNRTYKRLLWGGVGIATLAATVMWLFIDPVLQFVGNVQYGAMSGIFPWLLLGQIIWVASLAAHFNLYAMHEDQLLMKLSLCIVCVSFTLDVVGVVFWGVPGAVGAFVLAASFQLVL